MGFDKRNVAAMNDNDYLKKFMEEIIDIHGQNDNQSILDISTHIELIDNYARYIIPTFFLPILTGILIMKMEHKPIKPMLKGLMCYPLFMGSWLLINFKCLFKRELTWEKIEHVRSIKINEMSKIEEHI